MSRWEYTKRVPKKYTDWRCWVCLRILQPGEQYTAGAYIDQGNYSMFSECCNCTGKATWATRPPNREFADLPLFAEATR